MKVHLRLRPTGESNEYEKIKKSLYSAVLESLIMFFLVFWEKQKPDPIYFYIFSQKKYFL